MDIKPKKSLGQNFLKDDAIVQRIVESANLSNEDVVLEIGPGKGVLTEKLAQICKKVIAIEIDQRMVEVLRSMLRNKNNVEIVHADILEVNLPDILTTRNLQQTGYKVIANIPYYITSQIIRLLLETKYPPGEMILMVQKEVAGRIVAKPGDMSILAVSVQYYAKTELLLTVPRTAFDPAPEVDSAVVRITRNVERETQNSEDIKKFFRIVRAGFSAKRKTLANNLSASLKIDKKEIEEKLKSLGFSKNTRAQELGVADWKKLAVLLIS